MKATFTFPAFLLALLALLPGTRVSAQQDAQYTQFIFNKLGYNPGFAGAVESGEISVIARRQWFGLAGAPSSQIATFNTAFADQRSGVGLRLSQVSVGLEQQLNADVSYAYGFPIGPGVRMGLGISASARYFRIDYQNARPVQGGGVDTAIPGAASSKVVPNFGAGVYVNGRKFYVGLSTPRLLQNNLDLGTDETIIAREARHYYFMGGLKIPLGESVKMQPQALVKYLPNAPFDADLNLLFYFGENVFAGGGYRVGGDGSGESANVLFGAILAQHITFSFAYDLGLSQLNTDQGGSLEGMVMYSFGRRGSGSVIDPRDL
ncbi:type IX secretion system membrane protein PorP/SprF [Lewinella sp. 4G2]|uniref:PorP/SprF family type IX secretion system membrane protein n=1 Tax=Lewinella sp. 4G2 TaxID=1803372 RepID=UPI0007B47F6C|nr:type IX secretion system membrane protein PorP/SprF [Lewinella sp. 4G2]OAV43510.1 hypothetical protein A3850_002925 [Lewinella sp. 4G2]